MRIGLLLFLNYLAIQGVAQQTNLIPNSGFETIIGQPERWFYTGSDFNLVFSDWKSPTAASPDVYHDQIAVPTYWKEKGFYQLRPKEGKSMVGITLYGCNQGKLHCREYVSVPLKDSLVIGQQYYLSFWLAPMTAGIQVKHIQVAFDHQTITFIDDRLLELKPLYQLDINYRPGWQKMTLLFYAETEAGHLTIGNFKNDEGTLIDDSRSDHRQPFGYYYIDEVVLKKVPPILDREPIEAYDSLELNSQASIEIRNIHFDFDESTLLPESYLELNKLLVLLQSRPAMHIRIAGHTDQIGTAAYNQQLSIQRARAVADFLIRHYIHPDRLQVKGYGFDQPVASNTDETGRQKNRRVVFDIIK
jgi:outer membrane protein OmpA-like peptidoglycan-associated protein